MWSRQWHLRRALATEPASWDRFTPPGWPLESDTYLGVIRAVLGAEEAVKSTVGTNWTSICPAQGGGGIERRGAPCRDESEVLVGVQPRGDVAPADPVAPSVRGESREATIPRWWAWFQRRRWAWMRGMPKGTNATIAATRARKAPHDQLKPAGLSRKPSTTRARLTPVMRARS